MLLLPARRCRTACELIPVRYAGPFPSAAHPCSIAVVMLHRARPYHVVLCPFHANT